jgi:FMN reductase (NADPH)
MTLRHPVLDLFENRRTIRSYKREPLAEGDLERIIDAGRRAPTGALGQIYSVIRITDAQLRTHLSKLSGNQQHIRDAAEFFVFCLDVYRAQRLIEHRGGIFGTGPRVTVHYGAMDALLVAANMVTAAEALGYGTCYIGAVLNHLDKVVCALQLPKGVLPIVGLTIGVPDPEQPSPRKPRLPRQLTFFENAYSDPTPADLDAAYEAMGAAWFDTLCRFFGRDGRLGQREKVWMRALVQQGFEATQGEKTDD